MSVADLNIAENLRAVQARVDAACARSGRDPRSVTIVGVTKKQPVDVVRAAADAGIHDIGENYVQELFEKYDAIGDVVRWHFIGHLQRNKVKQIAPFVHMIHGVDSERLAREIAEHAVDRAIPILLQVNTSGEESKFGVPPDAALRLGAQLSRLDGIELRGLMTLAAFLDDSEGTRPMFAQLRTLRDQLRDATSLPLDELSMGMTGDFEVAIEEGATMVRIGTALFGARG